MQVTPASVRPLPLLRPPCGQLLRQLAIALYHIPAMLSRGLQRSCPLQRTPPVLLPALGRPVLVKPPAPQPQQPLSSGAEQLPSWLLRSSADNSGPMASTSAAEQSLTPAAAGQAARDRARAAGVTDRVELHRVYKAAYSAHLYRAAKAAGACSRAVNAAVERQQPSSAQPGTPKPPPSPAAAAGRAAVEQARAAGVIDKAELRRVYQRAQHTVLRQKGGVPLRQEKPPASPAAAAGRAAMEEARASSVTDKTQLQRVYMRAHNRFLLRELGMQPWAEKPPPSPAAAAARAAVEKAK
jgi:hypothetical protein